MVRQGELTPNLFYAEVTQSIERLSEPGPVTFDIGSMVVPSPNTFFVIGMFLTGRPKTAG